MRLFLRVQDGATVAGSFQWVTDMSLAMEEGGFESQADQQNTAKTSSP